MVTIEDVGEERSVVTPELRLRFCRQGDRWTHRIDIRPGPWQTLAEAVEWTTADEDPARVVSPVYQELDLRHDGDGALALLVGQAGPHHFSASVRVTHHVYDHERLRGFGLKYSESLVEFDVADRCRADVQALECHYDVHNPPAALHLGDSEDAESPEGFSRKWRPTLLWEALVEDNYEVAFKTIVGHNPPTRVAMVDRNPAGGWRVRAAPRGLSSLGTNRLRYAWSHTRVMKHSTA